MALGDLFPVEQPQGISRNRLIVIVPFHNPGQAFEQCLQSLAEQDYDNFEVLLIDDASTDSSARHLADRDSRWRVLRNDVRQGLARNLRDVITLHCRPEDIVVCLDGDDSLACPDALSQVNGAYHRYDCWVTYGQFQFANGDYGFCQPFASANDFQTLRQYFRTSHLRTFRAGLFHRIAEQDPEFDCLKDDAGNWLTSAVDAALMCPLLEMAGFDRVRYIDRILYIYNDANPNNLHRTARDRQIANFELVSARKPFVPVEHYIAGVPCEV